MSLALLQRFGPLLPLVTRPASALSDKDISTFAEAIAGDKADGLIGMLKTLRDAEPSTLVSELLGSETAQRLYNTMSEKQRERENSTFIGCPNCNFKFETDLL